MHNTSFGKRLPTKWQRLFELEEASLEESGTKTRNLVHIKVLIYMVIDACLLRWHKSIRKSAKDKHKST